MGFLGPVRLSKKVFPGKGDATKGRRPFVFHPQAATCAPPRSDFLCGRALLTNDAMSFHQCILLCR